MSARIKDLLKSCLFIGGIVLMALGWSFGNPLFFGLLWLPSLWCLCLLCLIEILPRSVFLRLSLSH